MFPFTIYFAIWYAMLQFGAWELSKHLGNLYTRQTDYLCQWEATGARESEFWGYRDRARDQIKFDTLTGSEKDEALEELDASWHVLEHRLRKALFHRASGTEEDLLDNGEFVLEQHPW